MGPKALFTVGAFILLSTSSAAHHGYAAFFQPSERTVSVEGDVEVIQYGNPHVVLTIRAAGPTVYTVTWQSAAWLQMVAAVTPSTFAVGDHLIIVGAPARDPRLHEVTMLREVTRPRDHWHWRSTTPFAPPSSSDR
jgi:hypothetical protein